LKIFISKVKIVMRGRWDGRGEDRHERKMRWKTLELIQEEEEILWMHTWVKAIGHFTHNWAKLTIIKLFFMWPRFEPRTLHILYVVLTNWAKLTKTIHIKHLSYMFPYQTAQKWVFFFFAFLYIYDWFGLTTNYRFRAYQ
jgi:hypothetical protein